MKRIRALTAAERALWAEVAATVKPRAPQEQTGPAIGETADAAAAALGLPEKTAPAPIAKPKATDRTGPVVPKTPPLAAIERRLKQRLSRGQREADAKIDLHGMRQDEAHAALHRFWVAPMPGAHRLFWSSPARADAKPSRIDRISILPEANAAYCIVSFRSGSRTLKCAVS